MSWYAGAMLGTVARRLDADGDLVIPVETVTGNEAIAQRVRVRLHLIAGEWFADERLGIPYMRDILGVKNPNIAAIKALIERAVKETPGVLRVDNLEAVFSAETRSLSVSFEAVADDGTPLPIHDEVMAYG